MSDAARRICDHIRTAGQGFDALFLIACPAWSLTAVDSDKTEELAACVTALNPITPQQLESCVQQVRKGTNTMAGIPLQFDPVAAAAGALGSGAAPLGVPQGAYFIMQDINTRQYIVVGPNEKYPGTFQNVSGPYSSRAAAEAELAKLQSGNASANGNGKNGKKPIWPWIAGAVVVVGGGVVMLGGAALLLMRARKPKRRRRKR